MPPSDPNYRERLEALASSGRARLRAGLRRLGKFVADGFEADALRAQLSAQSEALQSERDRLVELEREVRQLKKHFLGPKSEKIPTPLEELRAADGEKADPELTLKKRLENALLREEFPTRTIQHLVPAAARLCSRCLTSMRPDLAISAAPIIEYAGNGFVRELHQLEVLVCDTCLRKVTAPEPPRVLEGGLYGAGFMAYLAVAKCGDSIPIYRLEKSFRRLGIPMARSTMNELLHAAARELTPIYERMVALLRESRAVRADETSMRVQKRKKRAFVWTFIAALESDAPEPSWVVVYKFSPDRSGETPREVLGGTQGYLMVDAYSGYNTVVDVDGRVRVCCNAHARRRFHEALETEPVVARQALDYYLSLYRIEREAKLSGIEGTPAHLALRQSRAKPITETFKAWLELEQPKHMPKSPMGGAIRYALNHWTELTRYLEDPSLTIDNNLSEGALRVVALGRKNYLHFGHDTAGQNIAMLYSLVSSCEANHINPLEYLRDVLLRLRTHPASRIDELLPHRWTPVGPRGGEPTPPTGGGPPPESEPSADLSAAPPVALEGAAATPATGAVAEKLPEPREDEGVGDPTAALGEPDALQARAQHEQDRGAPTIPIAETSDERLSTTRPRRVAALREMHRRCRGPPRGGRDPKRPASPGPRARAGT